MPKEITGIQNTLCVATVQDPGQATKEGYAYPKPQFTPVYVKQVVVVKNGTEAGKPTVDFVMEDASGKEYVFMLTGRLIKSIPCGD